MRRREGCLVEAQGEEYKSRHKTKGWDINKRMGYKARLHEWGV